VSASPYRVPFPAGTIRRQPAELVYRTKDPERFSTVVRAASQVAAGGLVVLVLLQGVGCEQLAPVAMLAAAFTAAWRARSAARDAGIVLRVDRGVLEVTGGSMETLLTTRVAEITDVVLDTKTVRKVHEGAGGTPIVVYASTRVGPEIDIARIAIQVEGRSEDILLSDDYFGYLDTVAWLGRIRSFLRAQGWIPEDERE
jgi:hypothetical protein